jgi:hypothetical protein
MYSVYIKHPALEHDPRNAYPVENLREYGMLSKPYRSPNWTFYLNVFFATAPAWFCPCSLCWLSELV